MKNKIYLSLVLSLFVLCACASKMSGLQRQSLETEYIEYDYDTVFRATRTVFQNEGYAVERSDIESGFLQFSKGIPEKSAGLAFALGFLPGGGSFYVRNYGLGVADLLLWPWSIIWDGTSAAVKAKDMKKIIKVSCTFVELENQTEIRTGFSGVETGKDYGITLKRIFAEVRRQSLMRASREQTPHEATREQTLP